MLVTALDHVEVPVEGEMGVCHRILQSIDAAYMAFSFLEQTTLC